MAIRDSENMGKPISKQLSEYVKTHISVKEMEDIATQNKVSFSTLRDLVYGTNNLTPKNVDALEDAVRKAVFNYTQNKKKNEKLTEQIKREYKN